MDAIALIAAILGLALATHGYLLIGSAVLAVPLVALAILLSRPSKPSLLLRSISFSIWFVVPIGGLFYLFLFQAPFVFGLGIYYLGCISLVERKARYVPWDAGFGSKTVTRSERPLLYWFVVGFFFTMSAVLLGVALLYAPLN